MFRRIVSGLRAAIPSSASAEAPWLSKHLSEGNGGEGAVLVLSGLSANGIPLLRQVVQALFPPGQSSPEVVLSNLPGHTGHFRDFRRSRFWNWIIGVGKLLAELSKRHQGQKLTLIAHSTGAPVLAVLCVVLRIMNFFGISSLYRQIDCFVFFAPAFGLQKDLDRNMLQSACLFHYILLPASTLMLLWQQPLMDYTGWLLGLMLIGLSWTFGNNVWISNGEVRNEASGIEKSRLDYLACLVFVWIELFPFLIALVATFFPSWRSLFLAVGITAVGLPALIVEYLLPPVKAAPARESGEAMNYSRLPIITVANIIPLQIVALLCKRWVDVPTFVLIAGDDAIVNRREVIKWFKGTRAQQRRLRVVPKCPHSRFSAEQLAEIAIRVRPWLGEHR